MGGSLHYRLSSHWRSLAPSQCIGQSLRAKPMERSQAPKILRLNPDTYICSFPFSPFKFFSFCFLFIRSLARVRVSRTLEGYTSLNVHTPQYLEASFHKKLIIVRASSSPYICVVCSYMSFFCHYMHLYDLSFCQAGLPSSCAYALRSRLFG
jgi:hypothetical protein